MTNVNDDFSLTSIQSQDSAPNWRSGSRRKGLEELLRQLLQTMKSSFHELMFSSPIAAKGLISLRIQRERLLCRIIRNRSSGSSS